MMPDFRIYRIDNEHHIAHSRKSAGALGNDALAEAAEMVTRAYGAEVGAKARLVGTLEPGGRSDQRETARARAGGRG